MERKIVGKNRPNTGIAPAIALTNPKFQRNIGSVIRAASCFNIKQVWFTGNRIKISSGRRLPREERMKEYEDVQLRQFDYFFDEFDDDVVPVAVEFQSGAEILPYFDHPEKPLYVFGPEDGNIKSVHLKHCHRFVTIPTKHCMNLAAAVHIVLYDRMMKENTNEIKFTRASGKSCKTSL